MQEVARRADLAPGTVLNHFPDSNDLAAAVVADLIDGLAVPDPSIFDGVDDLPDRVRVLIDAVYDFYERSEPLVEMFFRERDAVPAFRVGEVRVQRMIADLTTVALGDAARDARLSAMVGAAIHPAFRSAFVDVSKSADDAKSQAGDLVSAWIDGRATQETPG